MFGAQESSHHLVGGHPHLPQGRLLELASKVLYLQLQLMDLDKKYRQKIYETNTKRSSSKTQSMLILLRRYKYAETKALNNFKVFFFTFLFELKVQRFMLVEKFKQTFFFF